MQAEPELPVLHQEPKAAAAAAAPEATPVANGASVAEEAAETDPYAFLPKPADNNKVCVKWSVHRLHCRCLGPLLHKYGSRAAEAILRLTEAGVVGMKSIV